MRSQPPQIQSGGGPRRSGAAVAAPDLAPYLDRFRSAGQLHALLARDGQPGDLATLLGRLSQLVEAGHLDAIIGEDGRELFRCCSGAPHHHLVCRNCGRTVEVVGPDIEIWVAHNARHHRYAEVKATVEMYGICPACDLARQGSADLSLEPSSPDQRANDQRNGRS